MKTSQKKLRYTKLRDWITVISLLYEKTSKQSMVDTKSDEKELKRFIIITLIKEKKSRKTHPLE